VVEPHDEVLRKPKVLTMLWAVAEQMADVAPTNSVFTSALPKPVTLDVSNTL